MGEIKDQEKLEREYREFYTNSILEWDSISQKLEELIFSHFDFFLYSNDCELRKDKVTPEEWLAYKRALLDAQDVIKFVLKREQFHEEV